MTGHFEPETARQAAADVTKLLDDMRRGEFDLTPENLTLLYGEIQMARWFVVMLADDLNTLGQYDPIPHLAELMAEWGRVIREERIVIEQQQKREGGE